MQQGFGPGDGRKRQRVLFKNGREFGRAVNSHALAQQRHHPGAGAHAVVVGFQTFVGLQVGQTEDFAKHRPGAVADHRQKNLFAVFHFKHVVHRPSRNTRRHGRGGLAGDGELHHVLGHQKDIVFKQRALNLLAAAGAMRWMVALGQCRHGADGAEHAAHDVVDAGAGAQRVTRPPCHVSQAAHHLHHLVERGAVLVRAGQKTFVADVDQPRVQRLEAGVVQPELGHGAGLEVLADDVGGGNQAQHGLQAFGRLQVQRQTFLVAVEHREKARARADELARGIALAAVANRFDLDDFGTQVGQHHAAGRAHHHVRELDHAQAFVGQSLRRAAGFRHALLLGV